MKKNFFKKLSFVLASAMVLTAIAPASGAFAAKGPKLNASEKYLFVGEGKKREEYNFNINNKKSGWKYEWASLDEDVVEVNKKNGVAKAVGIGTTKVAVTITDKDGELVDELEAKVIVKDNIKEVKISNPVEGTLGIGELHDFNRSFVTYGGSTKKTTAITRWEVAEEGATIDDSGKFTATEAGEYTVIARSFQSKSKYNSWLKDAEKYAKYVLATDSVKVKVAPSIKEVKQVDLDTIKVIFSSAMTDVDTKLEVHQVVGGTKVRELIDSVEMDDDKKVATVDMYHINEGATYVVSYPGMEEVTFVAATAKAENVEEIKITTTKAEVGESTDLKVELLDKNGVNITTNDLLTRVTFEAASDDVVLIDNVLTMYEVGKSTKITATYHTYNYDNTTGLEVGNLTAVGVVVCVEDIVDVVSNLKAYTIDSADKNDPDFKDVEHSISADNQSSQLYVQLRMDAADGDDFDFDNSADSNYRLDFEFKSSNENVLMVQEETGELFPVKAGTAVVVVKYDDKVVGAVTITVTGERKLAVAQLDASNFTLSNGVNEEKVVNLTVKDQYGKEYNNYTIQPSIVSQPTNGNLQQNEDNSEDTITFATVKDSTVAGTYRYKFEIVDDSDSKNVKTLYVTVTVKTPDATVKYYAIETNQASFDTKVESDDTTVSVPTLEIKVYGYDKSGLKNDEKDPVEVGVKWTSIPTAKADNYEFPIGIKNNPIESDSIELISNAVSGTAIYKAPTGTYQLSADAINSKDVRSKAFKVVDTQKAPVVSVKDWSTEETDVVAAIKDCIEVKYDGNTVADADIIITSDDYRATTYSVYVEKVVYRQEITQDGAHFGYIYHELKVGKTFRYAQ